MSGQREDKGGTLREKIADLLAYFDECGPGPVSRGEYLEDADDILKLVELEEAERAELEVLRDLRARVIGFGGDDFTIAPWIDIHRLHTDEPYIGCPFCRERFEVVDQHPSQRSNDAPSTGPSPPLIRTQKTEE